MNRAAGAVEACVVAVTDQVARPVIYIREADFADVAARIEGLTGIVIVRIGVAVRGDVQEVVTLIVLTGGADAFFRK